MCFMFANYKYVFHLENFKFSMSCNFVERFNFVATADESYAFAGL